MLTLYHAPLSLAPNARSMRIIWLLEELGVPFDVAYVTIRRRTGEGAPDPNNPHPHKQVPALRHDGTLVTETTAITLYLTDAFPDGRMGPTVGEPLRAPYLTWLAYYTGMLEPALIARYFNSVEARDVLTYERAESRIRSALQAQPYLLGDQFSAADILYASMFRAARALMPPHGCYDEYVARCESRPAFARAMARKDPPEGGCA